MDNRINSWQNEKWQLFHYKMYKQCPTQVWALWMIRMFRSWPISCGCINSTSLPCQQHNTPETNQCLGVHRFSSHWTHYSVMKQVGHCAVCSATSNWVLPCSTPFLGFPLKHLPVSTIWTCINHLKIFLFWGVCQKFQNFCSNPSSRSAKAKRDAALLQPLWRAPCGHGASKWKRVVMTNSGMRRRNGKLVA